MLATVSTLTKCPVLDVADDDEERARVSVSSVHSPRHLAQTGNTERTAETSKWASVKCHRDESANGQIYSRSRIAFPGSRYFYQGYEVSRYRLGQAWIGAIFWLCICVGKPLFGYLWIQTHILKIQCVAL